MGRSELRRTHESGDITTVYNAAFHRVFVSENPFPLGIPSHLTLLDN